MLVSNIDMCLFVEKKGDEIFLNLLKHTADSIINTGNLKVMVSQVNIIYTWMQIICMIGNE